MENMDLNPTYLHFQHICVYVQVNFLLLETHIHFLLVRIYQCFTVIAMPFASMYGRR